MVSKLPGIKHSAGARTGSTTRRARWLILSWLAFWLAAVVYPCQAHHAPAVALVDTATIELRAGASADADRAHSSPAHDDGTCLQLSAPVIGVSPVIASTSGTLTPEPLAPAAFDIGRLTSAIHAFSAYPDSYPPPHTPLYLRVQRLLI
jgi:hypothetical protein